MVRATNFINVAPPRPPFFHWSMRTFSVITEANECLRVDECMGKWTNEDTQYWFHPIKLLLK